MIDRFTSSAWSCRRAPFLPRFSRIRSNTTMVSFSEYPTIVRIAATVGSAISTRKRARKPRVMRMSWTVAMTAARPKRNSNRIAR